MGLIHIDLFTTLDGVAQAPGGPDEDPDGGFAFGGWQAPLLDKVVGEQIDSGMAGMDALLLGRRTYDIFAAYWPHADGGIARLFNRLPKYVASRQSADLEWAGSTLLGPDVVAGVSELRERHANIHVIGSLNFVQTLFTERLFDRLTLWVYPILLGTWKEGLRRRGGSDEPQTHRAGGRLTERRGAPALRARRRHAWRRRYVVGRPDGLGPVSARVSRRRHAARPRQTAAARACCRKESRTLPAFSCMRRDSSAADCVHLGPCSRSPR